MRKGKSTLWTRDFTILTVGSLISMLGNSISSLAISLLVLDYTGSVLSYALFMVAYNLPRLIMPMLTGPYLDRKSRRAVIAALDFFSADFYLLAGILVGNGWINFPVLLLLAIVIGMVDSVYTVAFDSLFPCLVVPENLSRAYSISSLLGAMTTAAMPLSAVVYENWGIPPLFIFNAVTFFAAAVCETQIREPGLHPVDAEKNRPFRIQEYMDDLREGLRYIRKESSLLLILLFLIPENLCHNVLNTVQLPYFKSAGHLGVQIYTWVTIGGVAGRILGSTGSYLAKIPSIYKTPLVIGAMMLGSVLCGTQLFLPVVGILAVQFLLSGLSVLYGTLRNSGLQTYLPDHTRARVNSIMSIMSSVGTIAGQLLGGVLCDVLPLRGVAAGSMVVLVIFILVFFGFGYGRICSVYNSVPGDEERQNRGIA